MKSFRLVLGLLMIGAISFTSCVKKEFDSPPDQTNIDPNLKVTHTIKELLTEYPGWSAGSIKIPDTSDVTIQAIVVADDRSGNIYKTLYIDDSTAGLQVSIDGTNLYTNYPVGRKVYIKCRGLYLSNYGGAPQLGYTIDGTGALSGFSPTLMGNYIVKATYDPSRVKPIPVTLEQLQSSIGTLDYVNRLITLDSVEFDINSAGVIYTNPANVPGTLSRNIKDCGSATMMVYNSSYANFQPFLTPKGRGTFTSIFTIFRDKGELIMRDTTDLKMWGPRCGGVIIGTTLLDQDFSTLPFAATDFGTGWVNYAEGGTSALYVVDGRNSISDYAKISAFSTGASDVKSWLVMPKLDLTNYQDIILTFRTAVGFPDGAQLKVLISTNYSGAGDPTAATWTDLTATFSNGPTNWLWTASGDVSLNSAKGKNNVYVAFKYEGGDPGRTGTFEIDNIKVTAN